MKGDPAKIKAILEMEKPTAVSGVQRLIGIVKYLGKLLSSLSNICEPSRRLNTKIPLGNGTLNTIKHFKISKMHSKTPCAQIP